MIGPQRCFGQSVSIKYFFLTRSDVDDVLPIWQNSQMIKPSLLFHLQLSRRTALVLVLMLCGIGLWLAFDLAWLHYNVHTNPKFQSFCAISEKVNCETVAESHYSVFLRMPIAMWGVLGYLAMLGTAAFGWLRPAFPVQGALLLLTGVSAVVSVVLAAVSHFLIRSFCVLCAGTYVVNLLLFAVVMVWLRFEPLTVKGVIAEVGAWMWRRAVYLSPLALVVALPVAFYPQYWNQQGRSVRATSAEVETGVTDEGLPWIGSWQAPIIILEFSDYLCPHCKRAHATLRNYIAQSPGKFRLVHRHFPLAHRCNRAIQGPFHEDACWMARAAYCAGKQKKFWPMNDALFALEGTRPESYALELAKGMGIDEVLFRDCLISQEAQGHVKADIEAGIKRGVTATPTFEVNGRLFVGEVPAATLTVDGPESAAQLKQLVDGGP